MNFTAEQLQENFDKLISYIDKYFEGDRKEVIRLRQNLRFPSLRRD